MKTESECGALELFQLARRHLAAHRLASVPEMRTKHLANARRLYEEGIGRVMLIERGSIAAWGETTLLVELRKQLAEELLRAQAAHN